MLQPRYLKQIPFPVVTMTRSATCHVALMLAAFLLAQSLSPSSAIGQQTYEPSDPIASIDGDPVLLGELNYLLMSKLRVKDISRVNIQVKQASSALLVRQHLAMQSLRAQGGEVLQSLLERQWNGFSDELYRQGSTIEQYSKQRRSNERSVRQSRDWDSAWRAYLKSMMTDANLKRFYQQNSQEYASRRWRVSHIFIPIDDDQTDAAEIAQQRMREIASQIESESPSKREAKFAELARTESDGATAADGGMIGWVAKPGDFPAPVMKAIRAAADTTITQPVQSPLGYHLAFIHESSSTDVPFEQLTDLSKLRRDAANRLFAALVERQKDAKVIWYIKPLRPSQNEEVEGE